MHLVFRIGRAGWAASLALLTLTGCGSSDFRAVQSPPILDSATLSVIKKSGMKALTSTEIRNLIAGADVVNTSGGPITVPRWIERYRLNGDVIVFGGLTPVMRTYTTENNALCMNSSKMSRCRLVFSNGVNHLFYFTDSRGFSLFEIIRK